MVRLETLEAALELLTSPTPKKVEIGSFSAENLSRQEKRRLGAQLKRTRKWDIGGNIVGYGISPAQSRFGEIGDLALKVYVKKAYSADDLAPSRLVPNELELEGLQETVPVDLEELGDLRLEALTTKVRPIVAGYSFGHLLATGTVGCLVRRAGEPTPLVLSCSHVIAASGTGSIGDQIYQPGPSEQDSSMEVVAKLDLWQPFDFQDDFVNRVDAALCRPVADDLFDPHIFGVGIPQGWVEPTRGMMVQKVGRTTGHTWGRIKDTHFRCTFPYPRPQHTGSADVWFRDQVLCTRYTDRGDSGALVLNEEGYAVGLHFAGSAASSIFNPISFVLDELGVELFTQSA